MTATAMTGPVSVSVSERHRTVVAVAVMWRGRIGLFRRSTSVAHDQGLWHCITGYVEAGVSPPAQALVELHEETGLIAVDLESLDEGEVLELADSQGELWRVHTFRATTSRRRLVLNHEHDSYRWVQLRAVARFSNRVCWLGEVLSAAGVDHAGPPGHPRTRTPT
jgi:8-oxo-dGTP pyrophosphatase MutT (NUDIX family)